MNNKEYNEYVEKRSHRSPCFLNCVKAFFTGGLICLAGEALSALYAYFGASGEDASLYASLTLVLLAGLLTGIGLYDRISKFGGGGALVPITGFANAMAAPAIDNRNEGLITGVAAKLYSIAGPVIVYGTAASVLYGIIYFIFVM